MDLADFDYFLPTDLIAHYPMQERDGCRLLVAHRNPTNLWLGIFSDLAHYLREGDLLILNNSRVFPARLYGRCRNHKLELLLLERLENGLWKTLVKGGKKIRGTEGIEFLDGLQGTVTPDGNGFFLLDLNFPVQELERWLDQNGEVPLPPYIHRSVEPSDQWNYQTVYSKITGSVAAPTAGLHFTTRLLDSLNNKGVQIRELTLHVGYGTFAPIRTPTLEAHEMHPEHYLMSDTLGSEILETRRRGDRVFAVGTSTMRALESLPLYGSRAVTRLFIKPGHIFRNVDGLITNFHLPRSSLLVLVSAFMGIEPVRRAYATAISNRFRFYSYGDAMLIL